MSYGVQHQILKETINLVSSTKGETILVCNFIVANSIMYLTGFNVRYETTSLSNQKLLHVGDLLNRKLFIDYNMSDTDLRIIARYTTKTLRKLKLENLLNNKLYETEISVDLSQYIN